MKNFTHSEVEKRFMSMNPEGSIEFVKDITTETINHAHVKYNESSRVYKYKYTNPLELVRKLKLATEDEIRERKGFKKCDCGRWIEENEKCACQQVNKFSFLLN